MKIGELAALTGLSAHTIRYYERIGLIPYAVRDETGALRGYAKVTRDLSERRESEEKARRLLQEEAARKAAEEATRQIAIQREQLRVTLASIGDSHDAAGRALKKQPCISERHIASGDALDALDDVAHGERGLGREFAMAQLSSIEYGLRNAPGNVPESSRGEHLAEDQRHASGIRGQIETWQPISMGHAN